MAETRLAVPDVSCEQCERAIEGALAALEGVQRVNVDVRGKVVVVALIYTSCTTVCQILGIDYTKQNPTRIGRPVRIVDKGANSVRELFA